jgi:hypothetical protein
MAAAIRENDARCLEAIGQCPGNTHEDGQLVGLAARIARVSSRIPGPALRTLLLG